MPNVLQSHICALKISCAIIILFFLPLGNSTLAQTLVRLKPDQNKASRSKTDSRLVQPSIANPTSTDFTTLSIVQKDSVQETFTLKRENEVSIIVRFSADPLSTIVNFLKGHSRFDIQSALTAIHAEHTQFRSDLSYLDAVFATTQSPQSVLIESHITAEYKNAFNGVALRTSRFIARRLQDLPYVDGVWEDKTVEALDDTSNGIIGAPAFWATSGMHGEDIDIGIIDTGIDYFHEALGAAPFPNAKVVGGYDIVNNDADPMDDEGHGTHVAGIAAGEGPLPGNFRGVAYKARLWAFKVLNANGSGTMSWVLSGIEKAVDPDDNPETPTPIEVLNLSLGGYGNPDDPISRAIDNATAAGIVCAVAAGNWGPDYGTISTPGCSRSAVTVGATDNQNNIASFSSRGPTPEPWIIKPDLVAPGVSILSSQMGGGYVEHSGTSMATPHVAGAIALLRQLHPQWSPEQIKALVIQTASTLHQNVLAQGEGRLSLPLTLQRNTVVTPAALNFGVDDISGGIWTRSTQFFLHNRSQSAISFSLSPKTPQMAGVTFTFNQSMVTIPAADSIPITVTIRVDNNVVPYAQDTPGWNYYQPTYTGAILAHASSSGMTIEIPFTFVKCHMLRLVMDETPWFFTIVPQGNDLPEIWEVYWSYLPAVNDTFQIPYSKGGYDIIGAYDDFRTKIVKENIDIDGVATVQFQKSDAKNRIVLKQLDHLGNPLSIHSVSPGFGWEQALINQKGRGISTNHGFWVWQPDSTLDTSYFPDVSDRWRYEMNLGVFHGGNYYAFPYVINGEITSSLEIVNNPADFREVDFEILPLDNTTTVYVTPGMVGNWGGGARPYPAAITAPFTMKGYLAPSPNPDKQMNYYVWIINNPWDWRQMYETGLITFRESGQIEITRGNWKISNPSFPFKYKVGYGPPCWLGETLNLSNAIRLNADAGLFGTVLWNRGYVRQMPYSLFHNGLLTSWGTYDGFWPPFYEYTDIAPGVYTLATYFDKYRIFDVWGKATVWLEFDLSRNDPDPPKLTGLGIFSNGEYTDKVLVGDQNEFLFNTQDASGISSAEISFRSGQGWWVNGSLSRNGIQFKAIIPHSLAEGYISTRLRLVDSLGNALDYLIEPAFVLNRVLPSTPTLKYPPCDSTEIPNTVTLKWNKSIAASMYHLQVAEDSTFLSPVVNDSTIVTTSLKVGSLGKSKKYFWKVRSLNPVGPSSYSEVRNFTTGDTMATVGIRKGWNLLSTSLNLLQPIRQVVYPQATSEIFEYNTFGYVTKESLSVGNGYWIKFPSAETLYLAGGGISTQTINIFADWNLIGSVSNPIPVDEILGDPAGMTISPFFEYNGSYLIADTIKPGKGYWVKAEQPGMLILGQYHVGTTSSSASIKVVQTSEAPPSPPGSVDVRNNEISSEYSLQSNYPNPFNSTTAIQFSLAEGGSVSIKVYNILGQEVAVLLDRYFDKGIHTMFWNSASSPSGIYYYRCQVKDPYGTLAFTAAKKMVLIK